MKKITITIDNYDVFKSCNIYDIFDAMRDLYLYAKKEIDKHYTLEEKSLYHHKYLKELILIMKNEKRTKKGIENIKEYIKIYNKISSNEYRFKIS